MSGYGLRAAVVGAVESSAVAARQIAQSQVQLVGIAGHEPKSKALLSGAYNLGELAEEIEVDYLGFRHVNDKTVVDQLYAWNIDFLFVVGLSQIVSPEVRATAGRGCIGYHPTALPKGRGRAPVAWIVLGDAPGASTLFELGDNADDVGILEQVPFKVTETMDAADVMEECLRTLAQAMDQLLVKLGRLEWSPVPQVESLATHLGKRDPSDGLINWHQAAEDVDALIRSAAPPHPGAYAYSEGQLLRIFRSAGVVEDPKAKGVVGKILRNVGDHYDIQCGEGVLRVGGVHDEFGDPIKIRVGAHLATRVEDEIHALKQAVLELETRLSRLTVQADQKK